MRLSSARGIWRIILKSADDADRRRLLSANKDVAERPASTFQVNQQLDGFLQETIPPAKSVKSADEFNCGF
jgi:hypothetical protein